MLKNEYFLWGAGTYGARIIKFMENDLTFKAVIDNNPEKQGRLFHGLPVISYEKAKDELSTVKIVVALNLPTEVREFLLKSGFIENKDFYTLHDFIPRYYWEKRGILAVKAIDIAATTICNSRCEGCQTFIPMAKMKSHISEESIIRDIDLTFNHIDLAVNLNFGVGESLLNTALPEMCSHIFKRYSNQYGSLLVQTNGTIIPEDREMQIYASTKTVFVTSNYPENTMATEKLIAKCNEFGVSWSYNYAGGVRNHWYDFGDPRIVNEENPEKLRKRFADCWKPGMGLYNELLYICAPQTWSHLVVGTGTLEPGDAFNLSQKKTTASREELYRIISRQPPKAGYISHCKRCNSVMKPLR
jgi:hypothetical protein